MTRSAVTACHETGAADGPNVAQPHLEDGPAYRQNGPLSPLFLMNHARREE